MAGNTEKSLREIEVLIRARYPIIYIVSWEEQRVQNWLVELAHKRNKRVYEWTYTTGVIPAGEVSQSQRNRSSATKDPINAFDEVVAQVEPAIYIFKDLHPFLCPNNFAVIRKLKDTALQIKSTFKTLILVSPMLQIPPELEKEITVFDFPLPDVEDFSRLLSRITEEVKNKPNIRIDVAGESRARLLNAALGLTLSEAENVFAKTIVNDGHLTDDDVDCIFAEKKQIIRKSGLLEYYEVDVAFSQVGGLDLLKEWLKTRALAFTDRAREYGGPLPPRGCC